MKAKIARTFTIMVWAGLVLLGLLRAAPVEAAVPFRAFWKETTYPMDDAILTGIEPNVLFYMDTTTNMTMSMTGQKPVFLTSDSNMLTTWPYMRDADFRAGLMAQDTFGLGSRTASHGTIANQSGRLSNNNLTLPFVSPYAGTERYEWWYNTGTTSTSLGYTRWGRDVDRDNNIIGDPNCYYTPDAAKPYFLTFKDSNWANWSGAGNPPNAVGNGLGERNSNTLTAIPMPDTLLTYLPGRSNAGKPVPENLTQYLVPNDSKMYKTKLVLWRILSSENAEMLSRMRLGLATSFSDRLYNIGIYSAAMKRPPFRYNESDDGNHYGGDFGDSFEAYHNGALRYTHFPHGVSVAGSGIVTNVGYQSTAYGSAENVFGGVVSDYDSGEAALRHARRSIMRVPFDFMYTMNRDGTYRPSSSLVEFRGLIDGIEQYNFNNNIATIDRFVNDELVPTGAMYSVENQLYGRNNVFTTNAGSTGTNRPVLNDQQAVTYPLGADGSRSLHTGILRDYGGIPMRRFRNGEGLMTGTVLGGINDFFSPLNSNILAFTELPQNATATQLTDDTRGYFPVTGSCQGNWMIYFTTGNENTTAMSTALRNIYLDSKVMRGRQWNGTKWVEMPGYDMDDPIRTIFVGLVSTEGEESDGDPYAADAATDSSAKRVRKATRRMAHAGQPHSDGTPDTTVEPYFADNVPDLLSKLESILLKIRTERFASGAPVILPLYEDEDDGSRVLFSSSYSVHMMRQWGSAFARYDIPPGDSSVSTLVWEAGSSMIAHRNDRKVYTITAPAEASGTAVSELGSMNNAAFASLVGVPSGGAAQFRDWLLRYPDEEGVLGDMEHSGLAVVGKPALPGIPDREKRVYIQTNRGVLHSLNYNNGTEAWAFIPPNVLQHRIRDQKFLLGDTWINGDGEDTLESRPLVLLDGMLVPADITVDGSPKTYMLGALGWGGNSFYAMDVTAAGNTPSFLWAIDNARYAETEAFPIDGVKRWGAAAAESKGNYDYSDLGLTIVAPELFSTDTAGVGFVPGGLGYNYGADSQGKAFYVFEPKNGKIVKKIDRDNGYVGPGSLGMGVTPVTYFTQGGKTTEFFTGDSEGNVLHCDTTEVPADWKLKSIFRLRTALDNPIALTKALEIGRASGGTRWLFGGTADLMVPDFSETRGLHNEEQYIFGLNLTRAMEESPPATTSDLVALKYLRSTPDVEPAWGETGEQNQVQPEDRGWALKLRPKLSHATDPTDAEYVTTSPFLYDGVLYVATFIPRTRHPDDQEQCRDVGDSKLYALDPLTGTSLWKNGTEQGLLFKDIKIVGISASGGNLFLGIKVLKPGGVQNLSAEMWAYTLLADGTVLKGPTAKTKVVRPTLTPEIPHLQYWRESF